VPPCQTVPPPDTDYRFRIRAVDAAGNLSAYSTIVTAHTDGGDTTAPSAPTTLTATPTSATQINLSWSAATDNVAVTGYRIERCQGATCTNFAQIATTTAATTYTDTSVAASTTYRFRVRATDGAGNLSAFSAVLETTIPDPPPAPTGLVGAWAFDEGAGTTANDSSGNGNIGTVYGAAWSTAGRYGNALSFNGTNNTVRVPASSSLNVSSQITMSAWVKPAAVQSGWRTIMQRQTDAWFLNASNDSGPLRPSGGGTFSGSTDYVGGPTALGVGVWTHVALSYDGAIMRLYVNGTQVATKNRTGTIETNSNPLWIGGNSPWGEYFNGLIDDVRVYSRALSATEVQTDMGTPLTWSGLVFGF
jgi:chitodextrinase